MSRNISPETAGRRRVQLVSQIEKAMEQDLDQLAWMSPETKVKAKEKLHLVANKIGYPEKWRDYSKLIVQPDDAMGNSLRARGFETAYELGKIGKPVNRNEWDMTPPTVNAYYDPSMNDINFPAGILQPAFYDRQQSEATNDGHIGSVVGHELTHGFDDQGRQFDGKGNLDDWWSAADAKRFNQRASCLVDEYDGFMAVDDLHVNGKLTLGENTADNGGLRLAFMALMAQADSGSYRPQAKKRWPHPDPKTLRGLGPELVRQHAAGANSRAGANRPPFAQPHPRQFRGYEHAGVWRSFWLHPWPAHVSGQDVPCLVARKPCRQSEAKSAPWDMRPVPRLAVCGARGSTSARSPWRNWRSATWSFTASCSAAWACCLLRFDSRPFSTAGNGRVLLGAAFLGVPVQFLVQFYGLSLTTVSHAALMVGAGPVVLAAGQPYLAENGWIVPVGWH